MDSNSHKTLALVLLILTTILWGTTFIITKIVTQTVPIFLYLALRHLIAIIGFAPFFKHFKEINKKVLFLGVFTGFIYFLAIVFQTYGLQTTTAGKAGFITGLSTVIVPFIVWLGFKKHIDKRIWIAVFLSIIGMAFLFLENEVGILIGDILVLICAFFAALFIVLNGKYVRIVDVYLFSIIQLSTITLLSFAGSLIFCESYEVQWINIPLLFTMIYMGICATTLTFLFVNWSQQHQSSSRTAIIFSLEPVFAVLFGFLIGNEILSWYGWIGCSFIFVAILIAVIKEEDEEKIKKDTNIIL